MAVGFVAAGTAVAGTTTLTVAWPGSQSAGDIGLLLVETFDAATVVASGWTELASSPVDASGQAHGLHVLYKIAEGSDANVSVSGLVNHAIGKIIVFSGVDNTSPINATSNQSAVVNTDITLPSITTDTDNCAIVHIAGTGRDATSTTTFSNWTNANLASITEVADDTTGTAGGGGFGAAWGILASAGASGTGSCTQATSIIATAITVALKPASSGGEIAGISDITLGAATVSSSGAIAVKGTLSATLGAATLAAEGSLAVSGSGTLARTLDDANLVCTGKLAIAGTVSSTLSPATLTAAGELVTPGGGLLTATLADATVLSSGKLAIGATASIALDALTATGAGHIIIAGTLAATLAPATLVSVGGLPAEESEILASNFIYAEPRQWIIRAVRTRWEIS